MTAAVLENLGLLAGSPGGVPTLRRLFRQLAVTGVLTHGASEKRLGGEWRHVKFGEVFRLEYGENLPAPKRTGTGEFPVYGSNGVVGSHVAACVHAPCLVVGRKGSAGAVNVCEHFGCWVTDVAYYCVPPEGVTLRYAYLLFLTLGLDELGKGIKPGLSRAEANVLAISLPPLAEQLRIVSKVDELMALCDRLEARQKDAEAAHARLVHALLDSLTQARDAEEFQACWQRVAGQFGSQFFSEDSVSSLRQAVIDCATSGQFRPGTVSTEWRDGRLGDLVVESGSGWSPSCEVRQRTDGEWGVLKVSAVSWGCFMPDENKALPASLAARPQFEVQPGDFLISRANTAELVARSVFVETTPPRLMLSDKIVRLRFSDACEPRFVQLANSSTTARRYYAEVAGGTSSSMKNVTRAQILALPLKYPGLTEQRRIVAKVTELLALCDQLKARIAAARAKHVQLAGALVAQAVAA